MLPDYAIVAIHLADYDQTQPLSLEQRVSKLVSCVKAARRRKEHALTATEIESVNGLLLRLRAEWEALRAEMAAAQQAAEPISDAPMPAAGELLARIAEEKQQAELRRDIAGAAQLDRIATSLRRGARIWWCGGELHVRSANTPGAVYNVSVAGCTCPNGVAGRAECWHRRLYTLLAEMQEDRATAADIVADAAGLRLSLGRRLAVARRPLMMEV